MGKKKIWAAQYVVTRKAEDGTDTRNLYICTDGQEAFERDFINGKWAGSCEEVLPSYEAVAVAGIGTPRGQFYDVSYTPDGQYGIVLHALVQAVDPVTDLPLILATLKQKHLISEMAHIHEARLMNYDAVLIGTCSPDEETGDQTFNYETVEAVESAAVSVRRQWDEHKSVGLDLMYHGTEGTVEVWLPGVEPEVMQPVFVYGVNGLDPAFAYQRKVEMERLKDLLDDATDIMVGWGVPHFLFTGKLEKEVDSEDPTGIKPHYISFNMQWELLQRITDILREHYGDNERDSSTNEIHSDTYDTAGV